MAVNFGSAVDGETPPLASGRKVQFKIDPDFKKSTGKRFDLAFEIAEYNLGIGRFERQPSNEEDYSSSDEPDVRPPNHPYVPLKRQTQ
jgi:hypothetical protein